MLFKCHEEQALLNLFNKLQLPKSNQWLLEGIFYSYFIQPSSISVNKETVMSIPFHITLIYKTVRYKN